MVTVSWGRSPPLLLLEEVVVVDGDGELGSESAVAGQFPGGHGYGAGADEAVEEFLGAGAPVQPGACTVRITCSCCRRGCRAVVSA
ncbi:hypothetical protein ASF74_21095 [Arthrobacter sp. Leaf145]|nr:hypothetical protein ASF74_21095 [Arthrobacter sp. Leaf145]